MPDKKRWLPVRCCRQPRRILGFLQLDDHDLSSGATLTLALRPDCPVVTPFWETPVAPVPAVVIERAKILIREFREREMTELAVYSDDRPVEFWRRVRGFVETRL